MRVIAGKFRSRTLTAPRGMNTRPTSDRLRETLFNVLAPRIEGAAFLDLYAGSGANGIEALSRGARCAVFVEKSAAAIFSLRRNLKGLGIDDGFQLEARSVTQALQNLQKMQRKFDIIFLDPPYQAEDQYRITMEMLGGEMASLLAADAIVVAEHHRKQALEPIYGTLSRYRLLAQGDAALSFYRTLL
ncbi:MAG: 16S rRNA (guanine(966)-N(2))-methyltransferase RsmD [Acidobacterium ailaaui]|jgi:16S rRNA (guanine(966)-N(2))-methyltransferase RsmD|nr:16S rRNA (guanine(966)-N(2))-methyltransferase RsmD [Pseudacidobacterium ailaaui]